jgi:hypothetical protein
MREKCSPEGHLISGVEEHLCLGKCFLFEHHQESHNYFQDNQSLLTLNSKTLF